MDIDFGLLEDINDIENYNYDNKNNFSIITIYKTHLEKIENDMIINNFEDFKIFLSIFKKILKEENINIHNVFFYYSKKIINEMDFTIPDDDLNVLYVDNDNIQINDDNKLFYTILNIITDNYKEKQDDNIDNFFNILYIYLANKLIIEKTENKYEYIIQLHKKIYGLKDYRVKLLYLYYVIVNYNKYNKVSLLSYRKLQIKNGDIKDYLNIGTFINKDTVIIDPIDISYMIREEPKPIVGGSIEINNYITNLGKNYPCEEAKNYFKDEKNKDKYAFLCEYDNNIKIIHAINYDFNDDKNKTNENIKEKLKIIYKSIFKITKEKNINKIIINPVSVGMIYNTTFQVIYLTPEIILETIKEIYNENDTIPSISLIVKEENDFKYLKSRYNKDLFI